MKENMTYFKTCLYQLPIQIQVQHNILSLYTIAYADTNSSLPIGIFSMLILEKELSQDPLYCSCSYSQSTANRTIFHQNLKRRRGMQGYIHISSWVPLTALSFLEFPYSVITVLDLYPWSLLVGRLLPSHGPASPQAPLSGSSGWEY